MQSVLNLRPDTTLSGDVNVVGFWCLAKRGRNLSALDRKSRCKDIRDGNSETLNFERR